MWLTEAVLLKTLCRIICLFQGHPIYMIMKGKTGKWSTVHWGEYLLLYPLFCFWQWCFSFCFLMKRKAFRPALRQIPASMFTQWAVLTIQKRGRNGKVYMNSTRQSDNIMARISLHPEIQEAVPSIWFEDFMPALEHFAGNQYDNWIETELKTREEYLDLIQDSAQMNYMSGWLLKSG